MIRLALTFLAITALAACSGGNSNAPASAELTPAQTLQVACDASLKGQSAACSCVAKASMEGMDEVSYAIALDLFNGTVSPISAKLAAGKLPYAQRKQVDAYFQRVDLMCTGPEDGVTRMISAWSAWKSRQASPEFKDFLRRSGPYLQPKQSAPSPVAATNTAQTSQTSSARSSNGTTRPGSSRPKKPGANSDPAAGLTLDGSEDRGNGLNGYN